MQQLNLQDSKGASLQTSPAPQLSSQQSRLAHDASAYGAAEGEIDPKTGKRRIFGLGEGGQKDELAREKKMDSIEAGKPTSPLKEPYAYDSKPSSPRPIPISPSRNPYSGSMAALSPSRMRSSSPRLHSPASSEIFERNVQEPVPPSDLQNELLHDAHVPNHMLTEDQIPPALDASAEVITSEEFDPDEVEIVTATLHQPASAPILESSASHADLASLPQSPLPQSPIPPTLHHQSSEGSETASMHASGLFPSGVTDDSTGNYGSLDPNDARRVSFISFADVVQSEHAAHPHVPLNEIGSRDSLHIGSLPSTQDRTGRSPSHSLSGGIATPFDATGSIGAVSLDAEQSPVRSVQSFSSPMQAGHHGELTIQTMRQAVRKTASGDLGGIRSAGMSPVSSPADDTSFGGTRSRGNT